MPDSGSFKRIGRCRRSRARASGRASRFVDEQHNDKSEPRKAQPTRLSGSSARPNGRKPVEASGGLLHAISLLSGRGSQGVQGGCRYVTLFQNKSIILKNINFLIFSYKKVGSPAIE
jgi:hypothetical protein